MRTFSLNLFLFLFSTLAFAAEPISFLPLPVFATLPNEGPTYGFMPVFLDSDAETSRIKSIIAPSFTWNKVSRYSLTGRYFRYPSEYEDQIFQATYSTRIFKEVILDRAVQVTKKNVITNYQSFLYRADPYRRFFGIGQHTAQSDETSYTLETLRAGAKTGYNFTDTFNLNVGVNIQQLEPKLEGVEGLRQTLIEYASRKDMTRARSGSLIVGLRYDSRPLREYSWKGLLIDLSMGGALSSQAKEGRYGITKAEVRWHLPETAALCLVSRVYWGYYSGSEIPFLEQHSLGGSSALRGFTLDRFIDQGAWVVDIEQRIIAKRFQIEGSVVELHIDPFLSLGQVYHDGSQFFERTQFTQGLGFRAFAPPNVIGRIDIARDESEFNVYVELGHPF